MTSVLTGVSLSNMATGPWTDAENDVIVADHFAMLAADLAGDPYNKAEHNRRLQSQIGRGHGSIEYKHQNISAVLKGLGETWMPAYRPAFNFQMSLVDAVVRWLHRNPEFDTPMSAGKKSAASQETAELVIQPPPTPGNRPPPHELDQMLTVARKFDVAARAERNRSLGRAVRSAYSPMSARFSRVSAVPTWRST